MHAGIIFEARAGLDDDSADAGLAHQLLRRPHALRALGGGDRRRQFDRRKLVLRGGGKARVIQRHRAGQRAGSGEEGAATNPWMIHGLTVARPDGIGQQARPMFDSAFQDGVKRPGTREMTFLLAGLMALNAFAIDAMIPALPDIGRSLHVTTENDRQLVVIVYFLGFASTQLFWGPLADRFGRKPILAAGITLYGLFAACAHSRRASRC